jgi:hypothetical protein
MKMCRVNCFLRSKRGIMCASLMTIVLLLIAEVLFAQSGNAGILEANTKVRGYFADGTKLMYAVGGIVGLIGAIKVYYKWSGGDPDTNRVASSWFGACVFLVIVASVIKLFFGV